MQKGRVTGLAYRGSSIDSGSFAIKSLEVSWITARQIEAARIAMTRAMKREGQVWIRIFPDKPITKKPAEVRMGKGKGSPELYNDQQIHDHINQTGKMHLLQPFLYGLKFLILAGLIHFLLQNYFLRYHSIGV